MSVRIHVQQPYFDGSCPYPVAFLWINEELHDAFPCGTVTRRVRWLPRWVPFNTRHVYGRASQLACVRMLCKYGQRIEAAMNGVSR